MWYARSTDGARSFGTPVALGVAPYSRPAHVQLALGAGGRVVATWDDGTVKLPRVVVRQSTDGGRSFRAAQTVSDPAKAAAFPVLAMTPRGLAIAWSEVTEAEHHHAQAADAHAKPASAQPATATLPSVGTSRVLLREGAL